MWGGPDGSCREGWCCHAWNTTHRATTIRLAVAAHAPAAFHRHGIMRRHGGTTPSRTLSRRRRWLRLLAWLALATGPAVCLALVADAVLPVVSASGAGADGALRAMSRWQAGLTLVRDTLSLLGEFAPFLFLPWPLWLGAVLVLRSRAATLVALVPLVFFLLQYGAVFVPRRAHVAQWVPWAAPLAQRGTPVRVMTFNVLQVVRPVDDLHRVITRAQPDLLITQELTTETAHALDALLVASYPHRHLKTDPATEIGIGSRFPITQVDAWACSIQHARTLHVSLRVEGVPGQTVQVVGVHLHPPPVRILYRPGWPMPLLGGEVTLGRRAEVAELVPCLAPLLQEGAPVIVAGDLNMTDQAPEYRWLRHAGLVDTYREAGWGFGLTFPANPITRVFGQPFPPFPLVRLDYILHSPGVQAQRTTVWPDAGTADHYPVVADLVLPRQ